MSNKIPTIVDDKLYRRRQYKRFEIETYSKQVLSLVKGLTDMAISRFNVDPPTTRVMDNYRISRKQIAGLTGTRFNVIVNPMMLRYFRVEFMGDSAEIIIHFSEINDEDRTVTPYILTLKKVVEEFKGRQDVYHKNLVPGRRHAVKYRY